MLASARLALALTLLLPAVAAAQSELSGVWSIPQSNTKHRPGLALFYGKEEGGSVDRYKVRLILHGSTGTISKTELKAAWDGQSLAIGSVSATSAGLSGALSGTGGSSSAGSFARYTLKKHASLDIELLSLASGTVSGAGGQTSLPKELRRAAEPDVTAPAEWKQAEEVLWGYRDEFAVSRI